MQFTTTKFFDESMILTQKNSIRYENIESVEIEKHENKGTITIHYKNSNISFTFELSTAIDIFARIQSKLKEIK